MQMIQLTVSEFNEVMADIVQNQLNLNQLCIRGEVSQFNFYSENQHLYITLKHEKASLQCVIYNQHLKNIPIIKKGDQCEIIGQCRFLKNKGQLIFSGFSLKKEGTGNKHQALEKLKNKLIKKGIFDKKTDAEIPDRINHVCIITSKDSAAFHDMKSILNSNDHTFKTSFIPATVQGILGPNSITDAMNEAINLKPEIICIARGGGAEEDFACFNEESLCEKISSTKIPILMGIGHQINITLSCLSANRHFETPTALTQYLCSLSMIRFNDCMKSIEAIPDKLNNKFHELENTVHLLLEKFQIQIHKKIDSLELETINLIEQLELLDPLKILKKGFIQCSNHEKKALKSIQEIKKNDMINLNFWNGSAEARITNVNSKRTR